MVVRYDMRFVKSFSRYDQTKLGCWALLGCLFISLCFLALVKPDLGSRPLLSLQQPTRSGLSLFKIENSISSQQFAAKSEIKIQETKSISKISDPSEVAETEKKIQEISMPTPIISDLSVAAETGKKIQESEPMPIISYPSDPAENEKKFQDSNPLSKISDSSDAPGSEKRIRESKLICNISNPRSDICEINGDIRVDGNSSKIFLVSSSSETGLLNGNKTWKIKPYARKTDSTAMANVNELSLKTFTVQEQAHKCSLNHSVPAIVFSTGGYTGNFFHDFTDILVPLFITSRQFDREVEFLITNSKPFWVNKYQKILTHLSNYEIIDFDRDERVHCFSNMMVGLKYHNDLTIDRSRSPQGYSLYDFTRFLRSSYSLERDDVIRIGDDGHDEGKKPGKKPRLLIISRKRTRRFTNVREIAAMAKTLGFEVVVAESDFGTDVAKFAHIVNSCDVMMGVHGAGLTNLVFLPTNAVLIQVVPFGAMDWLARTYFGGPAIDMKLRYLEYKIEERESTLIKQYPHDHVVRRDPVSIAKQGWGAFRSVYLDKQNVRLDVNRFRGTLLKALELLQTVDYVN